MLLRDGGGVSTKGAARKGDRAECPECHRWVGYWPDKLDYHVAHLMPHRVEHGWTMGEWCEGNWRAG